MPTDPSSPKVAQPTGRMTAEQFRLHYGKSWRHYPGFDWLMEAFAEHCTAATNEELDASHSRERALVLQYKAVKQRAESAEASLAASAALVRELVKALTHEAKKCKVCSGTGLAERLWYDDASNAMENAGFETCRSCKHLTALLSREDVKKVLEEK